MFTWIQTTMHKMNKRYKKHFPHPKPFQAILLLCLLAGLLLLLLPAQPSLADPPPPAAATIFAPVDGNGIVAIPLRWL